MFDPQEFHLIIHAEKWCEYNVKIRISSYVSIDNLIVTNGYIVRCYCRFLRIRLHIGISYVALLV